MNLGPQIVARCCQGCHWNIVNRSNRPQQHKTSYHHLHRTASNAVNNSIGLLGMKFNHVGRFEGLDDPCGSLNHSSRILKSVEGWR